MSSIKCGDTFTNNVGDVATVVLYRKWNDVDVIFPDSTKINLVSGNLRKGAFKNPNRPTVFGKGYFGVGVFKSKINGVPTKEYEAWANMLSRCYNKQYQDVQPTYERCEVHKDWHNFQIFARWWVDQEVVAGLCYQLDKDILFKGNKLYSEDTCCLVPQEINALLTNNKVNRGVLPIGVYLSGGNYSASVNKLGYRDYYGGFNSAEEAFYKYKQVKEDYIRELVFGRFNFLPDFIKVALLNYKVEITD